MKKLLILLLFTLLGCSGQDTEQTQPDATCYDIIAKGYDERGNYIIINYANFNQKRYKVEDYYNYINQSQLCEPITLTQQPL
jgi:hypothetical protein